MVLVRQPLRLYAAANESPALSGERGSPVLFGPEPETAACDLGWDHPHPSRSEPNRKRRPVITEGMTRTKCCFAGEVHDSSCARSASSSSSLP